MECVHILILEAADSNGYDVASGEGAGLSDYEFGLVSFRGYAQCSVS